MGILQAAQADLGEAESARARRAPLNGNERAQPIVTTPRRNAGCIKICKTRYSSSHGCAPNED